MDDWNEWSKREKSMLIAQFDDDCFKDHLWQNLWKANFKGVSIYLTPQCSSYWKGSLLVLLDYCKELFYSFIYLFIYLSNTFITSKMIPGPFLGRIFLLWEQLPYQSLRTQFALLFTYILVKRCMCVYIYIYIYIYIHTSIYIYLSLNIS